jgi:hypothetical protein
MALHVVEVILSYSSAFRKVQTKTFPSKPKSTLENNFSEVKDKMASVQRVKYCINMAPTVRKP